MKASIITLHSSINYGSVLQTYATQKVFERLGHSVEFVDYCRANNTEAARVEKAMNTATVRMANKLTLGLARPWLTKTVTKRVRRRAVPLDRFLKKYVTLTAKKYMSFDELADDPPSADIYVTGSDQVWNSVWNGGTDRSFFLDYAPEGKRRIAYAASIGRVDLSNTEKTRMRELLMKYSAISMREQSGVDLLGELGIRARLVLDPTLMLTVDEWRVISVKPDVPERFILVYQLNENRDMDEYAGKLSKKYRLPLVRIRKTPARRLPKSGCVDLVCPEVGEFVWLFDHAQFVFTDSFHATAFSLNFNKQFCSVLPERFGTRIESILDLTGTRQCLLTDFSDLTLFERAIDWENVNATIARERGESLRFLSEGIG